MVQRPPIPLLLSSEQEYYKYYLDNFVNGPSISTPDGMRIMFFEERFKHAFYLTDRKQGRKTSDFAKDRAERMNLIREVIESSVSVSRRRYEVDIKKWRRIIIDTIRKFAVICQPESRDPSRAKFITAYGPVQATLEKMLGNPDW